MFGTLDNRGRLYVTESSGSDLYEALRKQTRESRISVLEDLDRDGVYEKCAVFATNLVCPMGLVWRDGKLYVADPPDLITLADSDGDGRADKRNVILSGFGHTDNGSLHGLIFGPDGWLYMTIGQPDGYKLKRRDGSVLEGKSGALLRCRADGSDIEVLCRGFENLVEIAFMPTGEIVGTDNWFSLPRDGVRDALVHLVEGGLYPLQIRDVGTPQLISGEALPPIAQYPAVALSGLMRYTGEQFPVEYRDRLFSAQFNTRKVVRHTLSRKGATFETADQDFLAADDPDFHPSDVLEDSDGSMLIVDTGSWYVHHCPTGRIRKVPATGGIYRVRYGGNRVWPARAINESATWSDRRKARESLRGSDPDSVALAARVLGRANDREAAIDLEGLLLHSDAHVRCAAAEALAHCGTPQSASALFNALAKDPDRFEEHALFNALHRLSTGEDLSNALSESHSRIQKAAMLLLDQPPHRALKSQEAIARLFSPDPVLRQTAAVILERHPEWMDEAAGALKQQLAAGDGGIGDFLVKFSSHPKISGLAAKAIKGEIPGVSELTRARLLDSPRLATPPDAIAAALRSSVAELRMSAVRAINRLRLNGFQSELREVSRNESNAAAARIEALRALIRQQPKLEADQFGFLISQLSQTNSPADRLAAADLVGMAKLDAAQLARLLDQTPARPLLVLSAARRSELNTDLWKRLVQLISDHVDSGANVSEEHLKWMEETAPSELRPQTGLLRVKAKQDANSATETLTALVPLLDGGDPNRGHELFLGKATCIACHRVGKQGGLAGPDLTKIGAIRSGGDLLEAIVLPNASFSQGYEPYAVTLKNGEDFIGVRVRDAEGTLLFRDGSGAEVRFKESDIASIEPRQVSIMPEGLLSALTREETRDLLAYLQGLR